MGQPFVTATSALKYRRGVKGAEVILLITTLVMPLVLGVAAALLRKPWWWAAALGVVIAMIGVIAPEPGWRNRDSPPETFRFCLWSPCG
jgi:hypothetical protein